MVSAISSNGPPGCVTGTSMVAFFEMLERCFVLFDAKFA